MLTFYRAANGEYAWRLRAANGRNITTPGETFVEKRGARRNFRALATVLGVTKKRLAELELTAVEVW